MNEREDFEEWAIVELMGHVQFAGRVSEQSIGGCSFVRLDVPEGKGRPAFCKLWGGGAIYCITITDEKTARAVADNLTPLPLPRWSGETFADRQRRERIDDGIGEDDEDVYGPRPEEDS